MTIASKKQATIKESIENMERICLKSHLLWQIVNKVILYILKKKNV